MQTRTQRRQTKQTKRLWSSSWSLRREGAPVGHTRRRNAGNAGGMWANSRSRPPRFSAAALTPAPDPPRFLTTRAPPIRHLFPRLPPRVPFDNSRRPPMFTRRATAAALALPLALLGCASDSGTKPAEPAKPAPATTTAKPAPAPAPATTAKPPAPADEDRP